MEARGKEKEERGGVGSFQVYDLLSCVLFVLLYCSGLKLDLKAFKDLRDLISSSSSKSFGIFLGPAHRFRETISTASPIFLAPLSQILVIPTAPTTELPGLSPLCETPLT